ncbi:phage terminase small subunit P27 family [Rhodoplanes roseus]|uniref:phage terminase small subunit P27 family n=1 Tax=Rhodoplanes roseus TaxID=29409 RepID=UPI001FE1B62B|nr:phage terminase small subunit P27 family [Rhodoplanes roseus]
MKPVDGALRRVPVAPRNLTDEAKAEWRRVAPDLVRRKVLTVDNLSLLESYAMAIGMVKISADTLRVEGHAVPTAKGGMQRHPAVQTMREFMCEGRRLAAELGLTPTSRNKVGAPTEDQDDDLADLGV